jgi:thiol-disulfide isomerase/thioredoxin
MRASLALLLALVALPFAAAAAEPGFAFADPPKALREIRFTDGEGRTRTLADFSGKVVLLNIWATWCTPCREEMPTLDRLQAALGGDAFEVVALSIDRQGLAVVRRFYDQIGISHLATYIDSSSRAFRDLAIVGVPTTLLVDREGRELGRLVGPAEWDTPAMIALIRGRIASEPQTQ